MTRGPEPSAGSRGSSGIADPPARSQPSRKTIAASHAVCPSTRACVSRNTPSDGRSDEPYSSPMFMPPV